jgi:hypothetical protein
MGMAIGLVGCGGPKGADAVRDISTSDQISGLVTFTNYSVVIKAEVDWAALSDSEKQAIIDYAVKECRKQAKENDVNNMNIIGVSESGDTLFLLDRANSEMMIFVNNELSGRLPIPAETQ